MNECSWIHTCQECGAMFVDGVAFVKHVAYDHKEVESGKEKEGKPEVNKTLHPR